MFFSEILQQVSILNSNYNVGMDDFEVLKNMIDYDYKLVLLNMVVI